MSEHRYLENVVTLDNLCTGFREESVTAPVIVLSTTWALRVDCSRNAVRMMARIFTRTSRRDAITIAKRALEPEGKLTRGRCDACHRNRIAAKS